MSIASPRQTLACLLCLALVGCDDSEPAPLPCVEATVEVSSEGLVVDAGCGRLSLLPGVLIGDQWISPDEGSCEAADNELRCLLDDVGTVVAEMEGTRVEISLEATRDVAVSGFALQGPLTLEGADSWLSNGFQSWSQSGVIAIGARPTEGATRAALALRGDPETLRGGSELSHWHTFAGSESGPSLVAGATSADRFRPWFQVARGEEEGALWLRMACGGGGESVAVSSGDTLEGEVFFLEIGRELEASLERYAAGLTTRREEVAVEPEVGWNSWYELWDGVDEAAVRANAELAWEILEPRFGDDGSLRIVVDDGWQRAWGEWEANEEFPAGMDGLAADLRAQGFEMGIWLAPLLVSDESVLVADHPEWFVAETTFEHVVNGTMRVLDPTHPEAAAYLQDFIARIVSWGYDLLKIDFLFAGTFEGERHQDVTGLEAYHLALELIREAAGDEVILLAVGAPPIPSFPYVDAWRLGADIAFEPVGPSWYFVVNQARSLAARWPLCRVTLCDADPLLMRDLTQNEVGSAAWVVALAGGGLFLSDDLRALSEERWTWGLDDARRAALMSGEPSIPLDPFVAVPPRSLTNHMTDVVMDENTHVVPARWRTPSGEILMFNFTGEPVQAEGLEIEARSAALLP